MSSSDEEADETDFPSVMKQRSRKIVLCLNYVLLLSYLCIKTDISNENKLFLNLKFRGQRSIQSKKLKAQNVH